MNVLAIETSTELGSVALCAAGTVLAEESARVHARHAETLLPMIASVLARTGVARSAIDLIAIGVGPGSFTGTRIGVATAKGLALALEKPIVGVSSLLAIAHAVPGTWLAPAVDAHKGEVYYALYERGDPFIEHLAPTHAPPAMAIADLGRFPGKKLGAGSGYRAYDLGAAAEVCAPLFDPPRASIIALLAEARLASHGPDDLASLEPMYLRGSDAQLPK